MSRFPRCLLTLLILFGAVRSAAAQVDCDDRPSLNVPLNALTPRELDQRQALYLFADAIIAQREQRLVAAAKAFEQAAKLDPDAPPILKALAMLYLSLERYEEALALSARVLELDPQDYQMSYLYGRQLRSRNRFKEACEVLKNGLTSPALGDRPDIHQQMEFDLGILYERLEMYADAGAAFGRSAALVDHDELLDERADPQELQMLSAEIHERAGRNYLEARDYDLAIQAYRRAQEKFPPSAGRLHFNLAQVYLRQGKLNDALTALDNYLALLPQGIDAHEMKIALLQKMGKEGEVLPWLEKASSQDPFNVGLKLLLARQCVSLNQAAQAERIYRDMADTAPTEEVYKGLFSLYESQPSRGPDCVLTLVNATMESALRKDNPLANNPAPAQARAMISTLRASAELSRPLVKAAAQVAGKRRYNVETLELLAALADHCGMLPEAEILYLECLKCSMPPATEALLYGSLVRVQWKAERYDAVIATCRAGLERAQANNRVLLRVDLARALAALERWKEALAEADQAVQEAQEGERFAVRNLRVRILMQAGKLAEAQAECLALLKFYALPGELLDIHYLLSGIHMEAGRFLQAEAELAECLKIDPNNAAVNNDLGYLWADQNKNLAEAEALIRKAIDQDRKNRQNVLTLRPDAEQEFHDSACYFDSLGWVLFRRGQLEAAIKQLDYATTLPDSDDPVIWDHVGEVAGALGQRARAIEAWHKALDCYQQSKHRKIDARYKMLQTKLKKLETSK